MSRQLAELDVDSALQLLREHGVGRLALNDPGGPLVFPVNYVFDSGAVVFRTDPGTKLTAATRRDRASFQIDHIDLDHKAGWSVLVRGRLAEVTDPVDLARADGLGVEPWVEGEGRLHLVRLLPRVITGRRITLPDVGGAWFRAAILGSTVFTDMSQEEASP